MDRTLSWLAGAHSADTMARAIAEIDAAIAMVALGFAISVQLCNLECAEEAAFDAVARAQVAGVGFRLSRDVPQSVTLIVGPRRWDPRNGGRPVGGPRSDRAALRAIDGTA